MDAVLHPCSSVHISFSNLSETYSDDGYIPDWQYMEDYIKSLHSKPITTKINGNTVPDLEIDKWEEFNTKQARILPPLQVVR